MEYYVHIMFRLIFIRFMNKNSDFDTIKRDADKIHRIDLRLNIYFPSGHLRILLIY